MFHNEYDRQTIGILCNIKLQKMINPWDHSHITATGDSSTHGQSNQSCYLLEVNTPTFLLCFLYYGLATTGNASTLPWSAIASMHNENRVAT